MLQLSHVSSAVKHNERLRMNRHTFEEAMKQLSRLARAITCFAPLTSALLLAASAAHAEIYPNRPITVVVPYAAGTATDMITRAISARLSSSLGRPVIVDNKPGANGMIGTTFVARASHDGYTLLVTSNTTHSAAPSLMKKISYDPLRDFTPIARTGNVPFMLVINPDVPATSVEQLTAYARANPGKLSYASANSASILMGATYSLRAGLDILHVPYKGSPGALTDVLAGRVSMMFTDLLTGMPLVREGKLRGLAVTTRERSSLLPEMPTMEEAGVRDFDITSWQGWFAPTNVPEDIVSILNTNLRSIVEDPQMKSQLAERGMDAFSSTPAEFKDFVEKQLVLWSQLIRDAGIQPE